MSEDKDKHWRAKNKDGTFVEGIKGTDIHVHYDSSGGSDVPVGLGKQGEHSKNIRNRPIRDL